MSLIATKGDDRPKTMVPEGTHVGRCYAVVDLGTHHEEWKGKPKTRRKVILSFEFPSQMHVFKEEEGEQPMGRSKTFTNSLGRKQHCGRCCSHGGDVHSPRRNCKALT